MISTDDLSSMDPGEIAEMLDELPPEAISDMVAEATDEQCSILFAALAHPPQRPAPEFPRPGEAFGYRSGSRIIVVLHPWGDNWRLTRFMRDGPTGHYDIEAGDTETLDREIRWGGLTRDDSALMELEAWTQTEQWSMGVEKLMVIRAWNACSAQGRYDLCHQIDDHAVDHTPAETRVWLPTIYQRLREET